MISMKEIAKEAGVSRATVSYVLNGKCGDNLKISEPVIRKVQATAQRLGYVRNELVNSVVTGKSRVIALISDFSYYMMPAVKGCVEEAAMHHCLIKLIPLGERYQSGDSAGHGVPRGGDILHVPAERDAGEGGSEVFHDGDPVHRFAG